MPAGSVPPEVQFLADPVRGGVLVAVSALLFAVVAFRARAAERRLPFLAAVATSVVLVLVNVVAAALGLWVGPVFDGIAFPVLLLTTFLAGTPGWLLWLGGYQLLGRFTRRPLLVYGLLVLGFVPIVFVVDGWQMARNEFAMARGYTVLEDAVLGQVVMWLPVAFLEALRRRAPQGASADAR